MRNSKYLILSSFYFDFNDDLTEITNVKKSFKKQTILDLYRYNDFKIIKKRVFSIDYNLNFIYLPKNIEIIDNFAFYKNQIQILNLSNCINLKIINEDVFFKNQIKHLKLPENIEIIGYNAFSVNQIKILDLSNYIKLKYIEDISFSYNQIKQLKLPQNIEIIKRYAFEKNEIKILDLSNYIKLKQIEIYAFLYNPLTEIKILDDITIEYNNDKDDMWNKFAKYYNKNNKKAGDYKLENNEWQWYPL